MAEFSNGATAQIPLARFPRLLSATPAARRKWRLIGHGSGVHWETLDQDLSVENLLFAAAKAAA